MQSTRPSGKAGGTADRERGSADTGIITEKHERRHSCAELMTPGVIRVH